MAGAATSPREVVLETDRLLLRPWRVSEAAIQRELWTERDPRVPPHSRIDADGHPTVADIEDGIRAAQPSSTAIGRAAHSGGSELSLGQVFRESAVRSAPRLSGAYSFDQFFSGGGGAAPVPTAENPPDPSAPPEGAQEDLEQFTAWLEGLKRK